MKPKGLPIPVAPVTAPPSGMSREEFEDRIYIAVIGHSKMHDVAAATALSAWDRWQAAREAYRKAKEQKR